MKILIIVATLMLLAGAASAKPLPLARHPVLHHHVAPHRAAPRHAVKRRAPLRRRPSHPAPAVLTPVIPAAPLDTTPRLTDFANLMFSGTASENAPELDTDLGTGTMLGGTPLTFEKTRLDDLQHQYGGFEHTQGDAGDGVTWLCYTWRLANDGSGPTTVWFMSSNEMADVGHTLSMLVVEKIDASRLGGCADAPAALVMPSFSVPALGASLTDITAKLGHAPIDRPTHSVYYDSVRARNDGSGMSVYQTLGYLLDGGETATGFALSQATTD
jgi:hypothetical protein